MKICSVNIAYVKFETMLLESALKYFLNSFYSIFNRLTATKWAKNKCNSPV